LEQEVMAVVRASKEPLTPAAVREALGRQLAYTTVMTVLVRLLAKGLVTRRKVGRAYAYSPTYQAEDDAAQAMTKLLAQGRNPEGVLSRFVERLEDEEEAVLRRLLERGDG
jgi:predicted transcriptional regulator